MRIQSGPVTPDDWARAVVRAPVVDVQIGASSIVRRWTGTPAAVSQPPLDHHYVAMHLGGAKRVTRRAAGKTLICDVVNRSLTMVTAGVGYAWQTEGPIDYSHYYVTPAKLGGAVEDIFDKDGRSVVLRDGVGRNDPLLAALLGEMMVAVTPTPDLYIDTLDAAVLARLVRGHCTVSPRGSNGRHRLAPYLLRRIETYIDAHLGDRITLDDLAREAGLSRYHFARSFAATTGRPPHTYLQGRRLELAKRLIRESTAPIGAIARACGYPRPEHFSVMFKANVGVSPRRYRNAHR